MISRLRASLAIAALLASAVYAEAPNDQYFASKGSWKQAYPDQWGLQRIGLTNFGSGGWDIASGADHPVIVAVIDTGLDWQHPDLRNDNIWRNTGEAQNGIDDDHNGYVDDLIGWNFLDRNANPWDLAGHGTFVAGIIAAATGNAEGIASINPHVKIMPLKALSFMGAGRATLVAEAIYYAVRNGAKVINLSLGSPKFSAAEDLAIRYAQDKDVLVVVASGNDGGDIAEFGPAGFGNVITVAATTPTDVRAPYSNFGAQVDISAPGSDILSLRARRTDFILMTLPKRYLPGEAFVGVGAKYYRASGTSFAAPFVSGVASLIWSKYPELSAADVRRLLLQSARDIGPPGVDQNTGYGLLDAKAALGADPKFFTEAAIDGVSVVRRGNAMVLQVKGTADADQMKAAVIEIGAGENPSTWTKVSNPITAPVRSGVLDEIDASRFAGAKQWTLRVVVEHTNGRKREARFVVTVG